jgi:hypothetical protein
MRYVAAFYNIANGTIANATSTTATVGMFVMLRIVCVIVFFIVFAFET